MNNTTVGIHNLGPALFFSQTPDQSETHVSSYKMRMDRRACASYAHVGACEAQAVKITSLRMKPRDTCVHMYYTHVWTHMKLHCTSRKATWNASFPNPKYTQVFLYFTSYHMMRRKHLAKCQSTRWGTTLSNMV